MASRTRRHREKTLTRLEAEIEEIKARMWDDDFDSVVDAIPLMVFEPLIDEKNAKFVRILRHCCEDVVPGYSKECDFNNAKIVRIKGTQIKLDLTSYTNNFEVVCEVNGKSYTPTCHPPREYGEYLNDDGDDDDEVCDAPPRWVDGGVITPTKLAMLAWCIKNQKLPDGKDGEIYIIKSIEVMY